MKLILLISALCIKVCQISAQDINYYFESITHTYQSLSNPNSITNGLVWDDPDAVIPIGFNFQIFDQNLSTLILSGLGGTLQTTTMSHGIMVTNADLADRAYDTGETTGLSDISYQLSGEEGSRIFKLEWKNAGFLDDDTKNYYVNIQLWLYEGSNMIEIHYGPSYTNSMQYAWEEDFCAIAEQTPNEETYNAYFLEFINNNYQLNYNIVDDFTQPSYFENFPTDGTVFRIYPENAVGLEQQNMAISMFPNPCDDVLWLEQGERKDFRYSVYNALGEMLIQDNSSESLLKLHTGSLKSGLYIIRIESERINEVYRFIKK